MICPRCQREACPACEALREIAEKVGTIGAHISRLPRGRWPVEADRMILEGALDMEHPDGTAERITAEGVTCTGAEVSARLRELTRDGYWPKAAVLRALGGGEE